MQNTIITIVHNAHTLLPINLRKPDFTRLVKSDFASLTRDADFCPILPILTSRSFFIKGEAEYRLL
jgi:hypothetical protein